MTSILRYQLLFMAMLLCGAANAQNLITHLSGTQPVNGINVTVVPAGAAQTSTFCGGGPYWIGNAFGASTGSFTFKFSTPVTGVKLILQAVNIGEVNCITINGSPYLLTSSNVSPLSNNCGFQTFSQLQAGCITELNNTVSGCELDINFCAGIDSFTMENNGLVSGTVFSIEYKNDVINALAVSSNSPVCIGSPIQLTMTTPYILGATYDWNGPNGYTASLVNPNTSIPNAQVVNSGVYSLTVSTVCTTATVSVNVVVLPPPSITSTDIFHPTSCNGNDGAIVLHGLAPNVTYLVNYNYNGAPQPPITLTTDANGALILPGLPAGVYDNIIVGSGNCASSPAGPFTLINGPFVITAVAADMSACNANDGSITISGLNPGASYTIDYTLNGVTQTAIILTANSSGQVVMAGLSQGVYDNIVASNVSCVSASAGPFTINNVPLLLPSASGSTPLCEGDNLQLTAAPVAGASYSWTGPSGFTAAVQNPSVTGVTPAAGGTYTVTASLNGCTTLPVDVMITVYPLPPAPITKDITYCMNSVAGPLTAAGQNLLWYTTATGGSAVQSLAPSTATTGSSTYYVSQSVNGCESSRSPLVVTIVPALTVDLLVSRDTICVHDTVTVSAITSAGPGLQYDWSADMNGIVSGQGGGPHTITWDGFGTASVSLTVSDSFCSATAMVNVHIDTPVALFFDMAAHACVNEVVSISKVNYAGEVSAVYTWSFDGGSLLNGTQGGPYNISWPQEGPKQVQVKVAGICDNSYSAVVIVHTPPVAKIEHDVEGRVCEGTPVSFSAYNYGGAYAYRWRNIDASQNDGPVISGMVEASGYVTLKAIDKYGCFSEDSVYVDVQPCCQLYIPSVFSPNGDGKNDVFLPRTSGFEHFVNFQVVNRWGQKVFETKSKNAGWDGTLNGVPQDIGTYTYVVNYYCGDKPVQKTGNVTLVR